ncbi:MAG: MBL fold metallo-hydrolase [Saprospiraceae bacterium]
MPTHQITLGQFQCYALEDNSTITDVRNEFTQVPEDELLAAMQANGYKDFHVKIGFNNLLIKTPEHLVLIDCGTGENNLVNSLREAGFSPDDIDYVVITHSDFDHIGGLDFFTNARIVFPKTAYDLWVTEISREKMITSFVEVFSKLFPKNFVEEGVKYRRHYGSQKLPALLSRIILVKEEEQFLPGLRMIATPGHRPDHYAVEISSEEQTILHIADGWRHKIQKEHPEWYSVYDNYPDQFAESIKLALNRARDKKAMIFGSHFTWPGFDDSEMG